MRTLVALKDVFLAKVIELEKISRHYLTIACNSALANNELEKARDLLNELIVCNESIVSCVTRLDDPLLVKEKKAAENSKYQSIYILQTITPIIIKAQEMERAKNIAHFFKPVAAVAITPAPDSLDLLMQQMQHAKI